MHFFESVFVFHSPLDTIPGRQCMASCFFLLRQFEDVLIYLNSIKVNVPSKVQMMSFYNHICRVNLVKL